MMDLHRAFPTATPLGVTADPVQADGRAALRVVLEERRRMGQPGRDFVDQPTFLLFPDMCSPTTIEVEVKAQLMPDAPDYARGFIGIAWHVQGAGTEFEALYLRPTNGRLCAPPPPRDERAVQYFAYPDWLFDRLREAFPGQYEAGADISPGTWHKLRLDRGQQGLRAFVDGALVLDLPAPLMAPRPGRVGLWVDIGTEGWFADLQMTQEPDA